MSPMSCTFRFLRLNHQFSSCTRNPDGRAYIRKFKSASLITHHF